MRLFLGLDPAMLGDVVAHAPRIFRNRLDYTQIGWSRLQKLVCFAEVVFRDMIHQGQPHFRDKSMTGTRIISQNGNMLFIVLVGIALLGFLTLILSRSSEHTEDTGSTEQSSITASEILRQAGGMQGAFGRLQASGCSEYQISFDGTSIAGYANAKAPADESCHMFAMGGGGMKDLTAKTGWLDETLTAQPGYAEWNVSNDVCVEGVGLDDASCASDGDNNEETILWLGYLTQTMCLQVNRIAGVSNPSGAPPVSSYTWLPAGRYTGVVAEAGRLSTTGAVLTGKKAGCFEDGGGNYVFYQVLATH